MHVACSTGRYGKEDRRAAKANLGNAEDQVSVRKGSRPKLCSHSTSVNRKRIQIEAHPEVNSDGEGEFILNKWSRLGRTERYKRR